MTLTIVVAAGAVVGASIGGAAWWMADRYRGQRESVTKVHAIRLRPILKDMLDVGNKIEYDIRGDKNASARLAPYAKRIEDWRTDVSKFLVVKLPDSGADVKFLTFKPRVGQGGLMYEYERLNDMRTNLASIIENLESYCGRSSSLPQGVDGLVILRAEGVALRNRQISSNAQWTDFHHDFEEWQTRVKKEMRSVGVKPGDLGWFETLDRVPALTFSHAFNPLHAKDLAELSEKLDRLQKIIERHEQR